MIEIQDERERSLFEHFPISVLESKLYLQGWEMEGIRSIKQFVRGVKGWLSDQEGEFLYLLAKQVPQRQAMVEIGSWEGKSTIWLAKGSLAGNKNIVYAIDPHCRSEAHLSEGEANTEGIFRENIHKAGVNHIIVPLVKKSEEVARNWRKDVGLLWIDGSHEYEDVKRDFQLWEPHLSPLGFIAFHDRDHPGPLKVIREHILRSNRFFDITVCDRILAARKSTNYGI